MKSITLTKWLIPFITLLISISFFIIYSFDENKLHTFITLMAVQDTSIEKIGNLQVRALNFSVFFIFILITYFIFKDSILSNINYFLYRFKTSLKEKLVVVLHQFTNPKIKYTLLFLAILFSGIFIRIYFLNTPIHYDEGYTFYHYVQLPYRAIVSYYDYPNNHVINSILIKLSCSIFGNSIVAIRLPALFFGILLILSSYIFLATFFNKNAAIIGAIFTSFSPYFIIYSSNGRGYTFVFLSFIWLLYSAMKIIQYKDKFWWTMSVVIQVFGIFMIPTMLYCSIVFYIFLILNEQSIHTFKQNLKKYLWSCFAITSLTITCYSPIILIMGVDVLIHNDFVKPLTNQELLVQLPDLIRYSVDFFSNEQGLLITLITLFGSILSLIYHKTWRLLLTATIFLILLIFFVQHVCPPIRTISFIYLIIYLSSANGLSTFFLRNKTPIKFITIFNLYLMTYSTFAILKDKDIEYKFDYIPITSINQLTEKFKNNLTISDRFYTEYPQEASIRSQFIISKINTKILSSDIRNTKRIFILSFRTTVKEIPENLLKNEVDTLFFNKNFKLKSIKTIENKIQLFEFYKK